MNTMIRISVTSLLVFVLAVALANGLWDQAHIDMCIPYDGGRMHTTPCYEDEYRVTLWRWIG